MRVTTAFNEILRVPGAWVVPVEFAPGAVIVACSAGAVIGS